MVQDDRKDFKKWIVDLVFDAQQGLCSRCGTSIEVEPFQIHHKDSDHSNNELSNCELLCIKCHHKTFPEDAFEKHKSQETLVLTQLNQVIQQATDPASKMSGATLEKLIEGLTLSLKVSRNASGVDYGMMRTPTSIRLERGFAETQAQGNSYIEGYLDAVKATVSKIATSQQGEK
jgi:hypothetical protein